MATSNLIASTTYVALLFLTSCQSYSSKEKIVDERDMFEEVVIGNQVWMVQNLNVEKFQNGDPITEAKSDEEWIKAGEEGVPVWCYYNNNSDFGTRYGKLYNGFAINDKRGLAPKGWRIASDEDWTRLSDFFGGEKVAGKKLKSNTLWADREWDGLSGNGDNESGFNGLPGGKRYEDGRFLNLGLAGYWWSFTEESEQSLWCRALSYIDGGIVKGGNSMRDGFSVRCIKDDQ